jgi:hypothetical protein
MNRRDAKAIDKKMDDGAPRSGNVMSRVGVYTTESAYTEACRSFYPLSTDGIDDCILVFDYIK